MPVGLDKFKDIFLNSSFAASLLAIIIRLIFNDLLQKILPVRATNDGQYVLT